ncbi:transcriptional regulator, y4mF family [Methylophilus rhizosphaerae]|uniref:Transcriptional regulator, y4mF family n=1 Tax=Methylophilus rhizosphaerae TaxID=492660 RepID=A0A1G8ZGP6_9PROT|nr:helix-turn-helix transcriptional regulator [Methylophilus rhizosphaerae]SDK14208.1 transcriptional regulator, y4mF family [Methylophilus rhizosphaerae]
MDNINKPIQSVTIKSTQDLGSFVRTFRVAQKMTQADISGLANTGNRFIVELENGKPTVQLQKVLDVLDTLGLEMVIQRKGRY